MPERGFLIQGIRREDGLEFAQVQAGRHFEHFDRHRLGRGGRFAAVAQEQGHPPARGAGGRQRVARDRGIRIGDGDQLLRTHRLRAAIGFIGAELGRIGDIGEDLGRETVDGRAPIPEITVIPGDEALQGGDIIIGEDVEVQVIFSGDFLDEGTGQDDRTFLGRARAIGIIEETRAEARRERLKIRLPLVNRGQSRGRDFAQAARLHQGERLFAQGVVQHHAGKIGELGLRLLIQHDGTGLLGEVRQAVALGAAHERLAHSHLGSIGGPGWPVEDRKRIAGDRITLGHAAHQGPEERQNRAGGRLGGQTRHVKALLHLVVELHGERRRVQRHGGTGPHPAAARDDDSRRRGVAGAGIGDRDRRDGPTGDRRRGGGGAAARKGDRRWRGKAGATGQDRHRAQRRARVGTAVNPIVALAVFEREFRVERRGRDAHGSQVGHGIHFPMFDQIRNRIDRRREHLQRHGGLENRARGDGIVETDIIGRAREIQLAQHLPDLHGRTSISRRGVAQQHEGLRGISGTGDDVEIVANGVDARGQEHGVLLVGVKTRRTAIVLHIDTAGRLIGAEVVGADAGSEHDRRRTGGIADRVGGDLGRRGEGLKFRAGWHDVLEPPHFQNIRAGQRIHRDDGALIRHRQAGREGVHVGRGGVIVPRGDIAPEAISRRRHQAVADVGRLVDRSQPIALLETQFAHGSRRPGTTATRQRDRGARLKVSPRIVDRDADDLAAHDRSRRRGPGDPAAEGNRGGGGVARTAVGDGNRAGARLGLGVEAHIPHFEILGKFEQGFIEPVGGGRHLEALRSRIERRLGLGRIILVDDLRHKAGGKREAGGIRAAGGGHRVVGILVELRRPNLIVGILERGPIDPQPGTGGRGRREDRGIAQFQPIKYHPAGVVRGAFSVVLQPSIDAGGGAVVIFPIGRGQVHRRRQILRTAIHGLQSAGRVPRCERIPEMDRRDHRRGGLDDVDNVGPQKLIKLIGSHHRRAEVFHHNPALAVVGFDGADRPNLFKPEGLALRRQTAGRIGAGRSPR